MTASNPIVNRPERVCESCGRTFAWRRKWALCWDEVRYCSDRCRTSKIGSMDVQLERAIANLLDARDRNSSICPSEAARAVDSEGWRTLMEPARAAARRMAARGELVITQKGQQVDPTLARGPIRLRRP